jgi:hypothetical protein
MSEKFDMKVVIDEVTTPLLHARLSAARSYRERAALLRSLAESALRGTPAALPAYPEPAVASHPETAAQHFTGATETRIEPVTAPLTSMQSPEPFAGSNEGHDVAALVDQFASFLDAAA